jgi:hypothetical protein
VRKTHLARLLAHCSKGIFIAPFEQGEIGPHLFTAACDMGLEGRPDGIVAPFEKGEIGPDLFRAACNMGLEGMVSKRADRPYRAGRSKDWSKDWVKILWGGRTARGCGTLGALSNDTNGAPHVATF